MIQINSVGPTKDGLFGGMGQNAYDLIARTLQDKATADAYRAKAAGLKENLQKKLWDPKRQFFFHMFKQDEEVLAREVDATTFAVLAALSEGLAVDEALERAAGRDANFGPAQVSHLFEFLARCGLVAAASRPHSPSDR